MTEKVCWSAIKGYACSVVHNKRWTETFRGDWRVDVATYEEADDDFQRSLGVLRAVADVCNLDMYCLYKAAAIQDHYIRAKHPLETDGVAMFKRCYENAFHNKELDRIEKSYINQQIQLASGAGLTWVIRHAYEKKYGRVS